jgi:hypothetical protein
MLTVATVAALALAGCAAQPSTSSPASPAPTAAPSTAAALPATPSAAPVPGTGLSNVTISAGAQHLPPGPFKITPTHCGRFTRAERNSLGTNAKGGLIYKFTNDSNTLTGAPNLSVNFTDGTTVAGNNVTGNLTSIDPGQSAIGEVDAAGGSGNLRFTGCVLMVYGIVTNSGGIPGNYAP